MTTRLGRRPGRVTKAALSEDENEDESEGGDEDERGAADRGTEAPAESYRKIYGPLAIQCLTGPWDTMGPRDTSKFATSPAPC